jgi:cytochrome c peroxidase
MIARRRRHAGLSVALVAFVTSAALLSEHGALAEYPSTVGDATNLSTLAPVAAPQLISIGRRIFFDARLSRDGRVSCASCHMPENAFSDARPTSLGIGDTSGTRNTISLLSVVDETSLFWDGRAATLETQAVAPFLNPREHGLESTDELLDLIRANFQYVEEFRRMNVQPGDIDVHHIADALAAFERTLIGTGSAFDRFYYGKDATAMSIAAQAGFGLFTGRAQCVRCHTIEEGRAAFSDGMFHSSPLASQQNTADLASAAKRVSEMARHDVDGLITSDTTVAALGRFIVTLKPSDIGRYKTPSLRNVALTAPYMHDGTVASLEDAVELELYYRSVRSNRPVVLTEIEKAQLVEFLRALTSTDWSMKEPRATPR